MEVNCV